MKHIITGRIWKFGSDIDTDNMAPIPSLTGNWMQRRAAMFRLRPGFVAQAQPGDIVVAERNFGCGSSRVEAAENLKLLQLGGVVAESFARIFFRNCVSLGFAAVTCPGIAAATEEGDRIEVNLDTGQVTNLTQEQELFGVPYTENMLAIFDEGGLMNVLKRRAEQGEFKHQQELRRGR